MPVVKSVSYGHVPRQIVVVEVVDSELRWRDLLCVSTRDRNLFPSVLLQPLGHLSVQVESTTCSGCAPIIARARAMRASSSIPFVLSALAAINSAYRAELCKTS